MVFCLEFFECKYAGDGGILELIKGCDVEQVLSEISL